MIRSLPHERQVDLKDCGPARLKMISTYHGKYFFLSYFKNLCNLNKKAVGLRAQCFKSSFSQAVENIRSPKSRLHTE